MEESGGVAADKVALRLSRYVREQLGKPSLRFEADGTYVREIGPPEYLAVTDLSESHVCVRIIDHAVEYARLHVVARFHGELGKLHVIREVVLHLIQPE